MTEAVSLKQLPNSVHVGFVLTFITQSRRLGGLARDGEFTSL